MKENIRICKMRFLLLAILPLALFSKSVSLQILGSGGPEFSERASSSYIVWVDNKAKALVDLGGGSFLHFSQSGAKIEDLEFIALTHLHIDHSADLPAFMKAGFFSKRKAVLPILGTVKGGDFPNIKVFVDRLFGKYGAYSYMQDILTSQSDSFQLKPEICKQEFSSGYFKDIKVSSLGVLHGKVPAIAYAIEIYGKKIVFAGDTSADSDKLITLAKDADYLIVHHAIPQHAGYFAKKLHITPRRIGEVAKKSNAKHLILSHRMKRTFSVEKESLRLIKENYKGDIIWAEDMMKIDIN